MPGLTNTSGLTAIQIGNLGLYQAQALAVGSANSTIILPAKSFIQKIIVKNTNANAVTGGIKFGTTSGAVDIVAALAVAGSAIAPVADSALLKSLFSTTATQQIFIDAVAAWNSAVVDIYIVYGQLN